MLSEKPAEEDEQTMVDEFPRGEKQGEPFQCHVCGYESDNHELVKNCHPEERLDRERQSAVTDETESHTGFGYPVQLYPEVRQLFTDVETAIETAPDWKGTLDVATDVIDNHATTNPFESRAFQLFAYLVFLQQHQVLPGYPRSAPTGDDEATGITTHCHFHDEFPGDVTNTMIENSEVIQKERIYRAKVYSTTDKFLQKAELLPDHSQWQWTTYRELKDHGILSTVVFDEGAAHNAVVTHCRNWLAEHPAIDWVAAPHVKGAEIGTQKEARFSSHTPGSEPPAGPVLMYDFAGFSAQPDPQLTTVGFVIDNEPHIEIAELLIRKSGEDTLLCVFPTRDAIIDFIAYTDKVGLCEQDSVPTDDVAEHYRRQPSIPAINTEFSTHAISTGQLRFMSRKQLLDGIIDPESVFPREVLRRDGSGA